MFWYSVVLVLIMMLGWSVLGGIIYMLDLDGGRARDRYAAENPEDPEVKARALIVAEAVARRFEEDARRDKSAEDSAKARAEAEHLRHDICRAYDKERQKREIAANGSSN